MLHQSVTEVRAAGIRVRAVMSNQNVGRWAEEERREEGGHLTDMAVPHHIICCNLPEDAPAGLLHPVD